ncbi:MAG: FlgD immunoglobulin-like domain containing protein, partial [bacterium]
DAAAPNWSPVLKWIRFGYSHPRLTSSSSGATAYPQGRKLLRVPDADPGNIWICYEDSGKIYVAQSLDGGSGWVEKACVSGEINTVQCRYPCMAVSPPPPTTAAPDVYWIEELKRLWAAQKDTGGNWSEPVLLVDGDCYPVNYGQPSAAISPTDGNVHIAFACDWYDPDTVRSEIRHGVWDMSDYSSRDLKDLTVVDVVYGASDSCSAPSLEFDENEGLLHLTYARANRIWSRYWPYGQQEPYTWSAALRVSGNLNNCEYPFVNADDSLVYAVWAAPWTGQREVWWKFKRIDENLWPLGNGRNISDTDNSESRYPSVLHGIYATWCQDTTPGDWEIAYKEYPWQEPWTNISETPARSAYSHMEIQYEGKTTTGFFLWTDGNFPPYTIMVKPWVISSLGGGLAVGQDVFPGPISERAGEKSPRILVYPNPAADELVVRYSVQEGGPVNLRIFDASGRLVRTLNLNSSGGGWSFQKWDGCDEHAQRLPPGTYFLRLTATPDGPTAKLVLVR